MIFEDLISLLKKKGFKDTMYVLTKNNNRLDKHAFYDELNKFSYYNSFFRVKDDLIKKGLIQIENSSKVKYIKLTEKGLDVYNKLSEVNKLVQK
jgi:predicted transcriptional regulator